MTKPNTDEFKYEDDTEASAVEEIKNESEGDIMMMVDLMIMAMMMIMVMMVVMLKLMRLVIVAVMTLIVLMV